MGDLAYGAAIAAIAAILGTVLGTIVTYRLQNKADERRWRREDQHLNYELRLKTYMDFNDEVTKAFRQVNRIKTHFEQLKRVAKQDADREERKGDVENLKKAIQAALQCQINLGEIYFKIEVLASADVLLAARHLHQATTALIKNAVDTAQNPAEYASGTAPSASVTPEGNHPEAPEKVRKAIEDNTENAKEEELKRAFHARRVEYGDAIREELFIPLDRKRSRQ